MKGKRDLDSFLANYPQYKSRFRTFVRQRCCQHCNLDIVGVQLNAANNTFQPYGITGNNQIVWFSRDHIIPRSKGGSSRLENLQTLCNPCNFAKANNYEPGVPSNFYSELNRRFIHKKLEIYYPEWKPYYGF